jgi:EAL domain-containing protein (putative c-di-GMP-specific phosphodiesterase class I)
LAEQDMLNFIIQKLDELSIRNEKICFEITEAAAISNQGTADSLYPHSKSWIVGLPWMTL